MFHVATLITHAAVLLPEHLTRAAAMLPDAGAPRWLEQGVAADLPFAPPPGSDNRLWSTRVRQVLDGEPIDVVVQQAANRRKRLLVADMDSTIIDEECIDELAKAAGVGAAVAALTQGSVSGTVPFEASLIERVRLLAGLDAGEAARIAREGIHPKPGADILVRTMRRHGAVTAIASGGFTLFTGEVARRLGFDRHYANTLVVQHGRVTGALGEPIFGRASKRDALRTMRDELGLAEADTLAVGDGANDLDMLDEAGLGVAFHANPAVADAASARIDHSDLTALLYLQGYSGAEFIG